MCKLHGRVGKPAGCITPWYHIPYPPGRRLLRSAARAKPYHEGPERQGRTQCPVCCRTRGPDRAPPCLPTDSIDRMSPPASRQSSNDCLSFSQARATTEQRKLALIANIRGCNTESTLETRLFMSGAKVPVENCSDLSTPLRGSPSWQAKAQTRARSREPSELWRA